MPEQSESAALVAEPTYRLKRAGSSNGDWFVIDLATDRTLGTVFKCLGYWWADSAGSLDNRRSTKECAADLVAARSARSKCDRCNGTTLVSAPLGTWAACPDCTPRTARLADPPLPTGEQHDGNPSDGAPWGQEHRPAEVAARQSPR